MKPETRYLNRIRKIVKNLVPRAQIYKHADKFNAGIADIHIVFPNGGIVWIEGKWVPSIADRRKVGLTELQKMYLEEHDTCNVPSFVVVGSPHGTVFIHIKNWRGFVRQRWFVKDKQAVERFIEVYKEGRRTNGSKHTEEKQTGDLPEVLGLFD